MLERLPKEKKEKIGNIMLKLVEKYDLDEECGEAVISALKGYLEGNKVPLSDLAICGRIMLQENCSKNNIQGISLIDKEEFKLLMDNDEDRKKQKEKDVKKLEKEESREKEREEKQKMKGLAELPCVKCGRTFTLEEDLKQHTENAKKCMEDPEAFEATNKFECELISCDEDFTECLEADKHHKVTHNDGINVSCGFCRLQFIGPNFLKFHQKKHEGETPINERDGCLKCGVCLQPTSLERHSAICTEELPEGPFDCNECEEKDFESMKDLDTHSKGIHNEEKNLFCETCKKVILGQNFMAIHSAKCQKIEAERKKAKSLKRLKAKAGDKA